MDRRGFLKKGLLGGAVLVLGGAGIALQPTRRIAAPIAPLQVLDERGFQVLVAIAARIVTVEGVDPVAIAHDADQALAFAVPEARADLRKVLGLFENALPGLIFDGRARPFTQLDPAAQDRVLESWRDSRLVLRRGAYHALRKMCLAACYKEPATWRALRYPGPPMLGGLFYDDSMAGAGAGAGDLPRKDAPDAAKPGPVDVPAKVTP
ncbi:MAG: twin-arginine translocation signal domain-containing protein [Minicystis sp.]